MKNAKSGIGRVALYAGVAGAMVVSILPAAGVHTASAQAAGQNLGPNNIAVSGRFLEVWKSQGDEQTSVLINGYPITTARPEISLTDGKTYTTQWFERSRYEAHPENKAPYDVELGLLGTSLAEGRGSIDASTGKVRNAADAAFVGVAQPSDVSATKLYFPETKHTVSGIILTYWQKYGGLSQFGYPLSEPFNEVSATDGKTYQVQYFERNRFEVHPENKDPYAVELGLLGVQQYKLTPVAANTIPNQPPSGVTSTRKTASIAVAQEPPALNLVTQDQYSVSVIVDALDDGLINFDPSANPYPEDAWYVPTLENGGAYYVGTGGDRHLTVKYKIRPGIKWSDGQELTSNDAVFAFQYIMTPTTETPSRGELLKIYNVDNPDKYTMIYNFFSVNQAKAKMANANADDQSYYSFLTDAITANAPVTDPAYFAVGGILPQHILKNVPGTSTGIDQSNYSREGHVGTGPYMVKSWTTGSAMVLVPNPNYTLTSAPILQQINIKFIADNNQIISQLKQQDPSLGVDMATSDAFAGPSDAISQANLGSGVTVHSVPAATWEHIDFKMDAPQTSDVVVRQAIAYAIDRQKIVDLAYLGQTKVLNSVSPSVDWQSLENPNFAKLYPDAAAANKLPIYNYDPAKANSMLDAAGWVKGGDGIRAKGGVKLSFPLETTVITARQQSAQIIQANLKAVGIDVQPKYEKAVGDAIDNNAPMTLYAWVGDPNLDNYDLWSSQLLTPGGQNYPHYSNPKLDQLNNQFKSELERSKAATYAAQAQVLLATDLPALPLYARATIELGRTSLQNWNTSSTNLCTPFYNIGAWYFK